MIPNLEALRSQLPPRHDRVLIAAYAGGIGAHGTFGAPADARAEIGSVSKGLTGLLYMDAVERGDVTPATTLGEALHRPEGSYAKITLEELVTHTSGLPAQPPYPGPRTMPRRIWRMLRHGENPYADTVDELLDAAADVRIGKRRFTYSNLGFELLGAALAKAASTPFDQLLKTRVTGPLGMSDVSIPASPGCLESSDLLGHSRRGKPHDPWTGAALVPAGGVRATAADLEALLTGLVEGTAPGHEALDPVADVPAGSRIGAAWYTTRKDGAAVTWHNGRTGGFASWVGVDRTAGVGLALVSATAASLDRQGFAGLDRLRADAVAGQDSQR